MDKTIKQIADELGVSKQAVRNKIAKLDLHSSLRKNGNQLCVSKMQETLIKSAFDQNKTQSKNENLFCKDSKQSQTTLQLISMLQSELDVKNRQLDVKDKQIEELNSRLAEAYQVINHEQQLHVADKVLEITDAKEKNAIVNDNHLIHKNPEKKKKTWRSIFKK